MDPVPVFRCRLKVLILEPGVDQLGLRMVDQLPIRAEKIDIAAVSQGDPVKQLFQAVIADVDEENALLRGRALRDLHRARRRDHPTVLVLPRVEHPLDMRD